MITRSENPLSNHKPDAQPEGAYPQTLSLRLIELWLSAVLVAFFLIRIIGSQTARQILDRFLPSHIR